MRKKYRRTQERETTRDDYCRPADVVGTICKANGMKLVEIFRKCQQEQRAKNNE